MMLYNQTTSTVVVEHLEQALRFGKRFLGLMGRSSLPDDQGLYLEPCSSVHCFFMRFPLDVVFVDRSMRVVAIYPGLKPWRLAIPGAEAYAAIETVAGQLADKVSVGDQLEVKEGQYEKTISR